MRLVFAGTPQVAADTLRRLLDAGGHEVVAVLTRPDAPQGRSSRPVRSPVAQLADERGIEVLQPSRVGDPALSERLVQLAPDCCPVVAYGGLIPAPMLAAVPHGWVNVHYSLLPRWRGAAPVQHAILAGDEVTGVTVFELVAELDAGPVLARREYRLEPDQTAGEALSALQPLGADLLVSTLDRLADDTLLARAQPDGGITLAPKLTVDGARIDWHQSAHVIARQVRAFNPSPVAWTQLGDSRLRILRATSSAGGDLPPGDLLVGRRSVEVGTGEGHLLLLDVQPAGGRALPADAWGRGLRGAVRLS